MPLCIYIETLSTGKSDFSYWQNKVFNRIGPGSVMAYPVVHGSRRGDSQYRGRTMPEVVQCRTRNSLSRTAQIQTFVRAE